jgi:murein DD-endopeptidase MepM/ murein hydrolase activator NlpD
MAAYLKGMSLNSRSFDFSRFEFAPVIDLPERYDVYDFTSGYDPERTRASLYGIGRYNEKRKGMYVTELFSGNSEDREEPRDIHVGIDIAAPVGTEVKAFADGVVYLAGINSAPGDYGGTLITEHRLGDRTLWALHGHLSHASTTRFAPGERVRQGQVIATIGGPAENGGWNPHLHFQLSWLRPEKCDLPGVVAESRRAWALEVFPDPRLVLGPLY